MFDIPTYLRDRDCVPIRSRFGKFLQSHKMHNAESKIQSDIMQGTYFPQMSKYTFLKLYILNEKYSLDDYLTVKDPSLRGFLFETLWDICFKCNVVSGFDGSIIRHFKGKIEDLRIQYLDIKKELKLKQKNAKGDQATLDSLEKEYAGILLDIEKKMGLKSKNTDVSDTDLHALGADMKIKRDSLKEIVDLHDYLMESKVQTGSTGGISDITMRYTDESSKGNKWILVSSKYYINEKAIHQYDIADILQTIKGFANKCEIVLVVNDKRSLEQNIKRSHKKHTIESIYKILDKRDLQNAISHLRNVFTMLGVSYDTIYDVYTASFIKYFSSPWKPFVQPTFEQSLIARWVEQKFTHKPKLTIACYDSYTFFMALLVLMLKMQHFRFKIDTQHHIFLKKLIKQYYRLDELDIQITSATTTKVMFFNRDLVHTLSFVKSDGDADISWQLADVLMCKWLRNKINQNKLINKLKDTPMVLHDVVRQMYGEYAIEDVLVKEQVFVNIAGQMEAFPNVYMYSNEVKKFKSKTFTSSGFASLFGKDIKTESDINVVQSIIDVIIGNTDNFHEDYIFKRMIETNIDNRMNANNILLLLPKEKTDIVNSFKTVLNGNKFVQKIYQVALQPRTLPSTNKQLLILCNNHDLLTHDYLSNFDVMVCLDNDMSCSDVIEIVSKMAAIKDRADIHIVDLHLSRSRNVSDLLNLAK